jgi:hypothetical protein
MKNINSIKIENKKNSNSRELLLLSLKIFSD